MPSDFDIVKGALTGKKEPEKKSPKKTQTEKVQKESFFNPLQLRIIKISIANFIRTYKGNLKKSIEKGRDPKDCKNYDEIIEALEIYKKISKKAYFDEELYKILGVEK